MQVNKRKKTEEYRYQFLEFRTVETGRYLAKKQEEPWLGIEGVIGFSGLNIPIPITKEVAMVFDKKTGKIKQEAIKKTK